VKRWSLAVAAVAALVGGLVYSVYREAPPPAPNAGHHEAASESQSAPASASRAARDGSPASGRDGSPTSARDTAAARASTPRPTLPAVDDPARPAATARERAAEDRETAANGSREHVPAPERTAVSRGIAALKKRPMPPGTPAEPGDPEAARIERQERMNRTLQTAACRAPDVEHRLTQMSAEERLAFRERCARLGVTVRAPE